MKKEIISILCLASLFLYQCSKDEETVKKANIPQNLLAESVNSNKSIELEWEYDYGNSKAVFYVYRSTSEDGIYSEIGNSFYLSYEDFTVQPGVVYYYKVKAWTQISTYSEYSNSVSTSLLKGIKLIATIGTPGTGTGEFHFGSPRSVAATDGNLLYVADYYNHRIQRFNPDKTFKDWIGFNENTWGVYTTNTEASDSFTPMSILFHSGYIYVACEKNGTGKIIQINTLGDIVKEIPVAMSADNSAGFVLDASGNIFIRSTNDIYKLDNNGNQLKKFGGLGTTDGKFDSYSSEICIDTGNNLYIMDNSNKRIQKFDNEGNFIKKFQVEGYDYLTYHDNHLYLMSNYYLVKYDLNGIEKDRWNTVNNHNYYLSRLSQIMFYNKILYYTDNIDHKTFIYSLE